MMRFSKTTRTAKSTNTFTKYWAFFFVMLTLLAALSGCGQDDARDSTEADAEGVDASSDSDTVEDVREFEDVREDAFEADTTPDASEVAQEELLSESLVEQIERMVEVDGHPAIVVGVIDGDASEVYGFGALASGETPDGQTLFEIGSVTKTFTALLLADAVESNAISLDDPVQDLLPDFEIPTRNDKAITLEMLATHYSGLPRTPSNINATDPANPFANYDVEHLKSFLANHTLQRDPGASFEYSNVGLALLGSALSENAGTNYKTLLKSTILAPLGLSSTYATHQDAPAGQVINGFDVAGNPTPIFDYLAFAPAGSIISDVDDMLVYLKANMGLSDSPLYPAMQLTHQARAAHSSANNQLGLVWMRYKIGDRTMIWHGGATAGYRTFVGFLEDGSRGVVMWTNIFKDIDPIALSVLMDGVTSDDGTIEMTPEELDEYVGDYRLDAQMIVAVYREGTQLMTKATGQDAFPIFPSAKDEFFAKIAPISMSFERDDAQQVTAAILHQGGADYRAPRIPED